MFEIWGKFLYKEVKQVAGDFNRLWHLKQTDPAQ